MEVAAKAGDGRIIVVHHTEAEADHEDQGHKVSEVEAATMLASGECRLDAIPNHQDGGKGPEQVLPHPVEDPKVLLDECVYRSQDKVEQIHCGSSVVVPGPCSPYGRR